jgi:hypothetical protein
VAKLPENVTPLRRRKGRKVQVEEGIRLGIYITPAHRFFVERLGHGNVSKGIRELIERAAKEEEEHPI